MSKNQRPTVTEQDLETFANGDMTDPDPLAERARQATPARRAPMDVAPPEVTPADDAFLKRAADEIRTHHKRAGNELIEVGRLLAEVRKRPPRGEWSPWLEREVAWSESMALKFMQLHAAFGANPERVTDLNLGVWALSHPAAPTTPPEAREEVIDRVAAGEVMPRADAERVVQGAKAKLQPKEQRRAAPQPPTRGKHANRAEDNAWNSWGAAVPIVAWLHGFDELVTGGDAGALFGALERAVRAMNEEPRRTVLAGLELLGPLREELRKDPPGDGTRP